MSSSPLRLLIAGGGTGGHVLPAVAVVQELRQRGMDLEILWIGSEDGVERTIATREGIPFVAVKTGKLRRYLDIKTLRDATRIPVGLAQAGRRIRSFEPDVIFGTGGYVSVPAVVAGSRIAPVLTHEQTAQVGLANKICSRFADTFAVSYEETAAAAEAGHPHVVVTGNPVRGAFADGAPAKFFALSGFDPDAPVVFVTGGAKGSSPINQRLESQLPALLDVTQIYHQAGPADANDDAARLMRLRETWSDDHKRRYIVTEFVGDEMVDIYAAADLIVGRAGAGTVAELAYTGTPSILIPLPGTGGDEQVKNAALLARADASVVLRQEQTDGDALGQAIRALITDPTRLDAMRHNARGLSRLDAASNLADELLQLAQREKRGRL